MRRWNLRLLAGLMVAGVASGVFGQTTAREPAGMSGWVKMSTQSAQTGVSPVVQVMSADDGTIVTFRDSGDNLQIQFQDPKTLDFWDYAVGAKELRHGELAPWWKEGAAARVKGQVAQWSWEAAATRWKATLEGNWRDVTPTRDEGLECYKLADAMSVLKQPVKPGQPLALVPDVVWVDPATKMMRKTTKQFTQRDGKEWDVTTTYEYNVAGFVDVYAAGVPRDARIVDNRPSKETREVLERIERRVNKGFGDYVGVQVDAPLRSDGSADYQRSAVRLLARKLPRGYAATYSVVAKVGANRYGVALPADWSSVNLEEMVATMRTSVPYSYVWIEGGKAQSWRYIRGRFESYSPPMGDMAFAQMQVNVAPQVWPDTTTFYRYTPETQVKLVGDEEHKGLVGLQMTKFGPSNDFYLTQTVYWVDPAKNDVLMSSDMTTFRAGSALNRLETTERRTLDLATMEDGRIYPARWQIVTRRATGEGFLDPMVSRESRLMLLPGKELDASWLPKGPEEK